MKRSSFPTFSLLGSLAKYSKLLIFACYCAVPAISNAMYSFSEEESCEKSEIERKRSTRSAEKKKPVNYAESDISSEGSFSGLDQEEDGDYHDGASLNNSDLWAGYESSSDEGCKEEEGCIISNSEHLEESKDAQPTKKRPRESVRIDYCE